VTGPVQVLVVGFDQPTFSGEVVAEFARLRDAGIVRLVVGFAPLKPAEFVVVQIKQIVGQTA